MGGRGAVKVTHKNNFNTYKMKHNSRTEYLCEGSLCKKCKVQNIVLKHKVITEKMLTRVYYYSQWEKCPNCMTIWFDPKYIVNVKNEEAKEQLENEEDNFIRMARLF